MFKKKSVIIAAIILFFCCAAYPETEVTRDTLNLTLEDCLELGLANNSDVLKAREDIRKANKYLLEHFAEFIPIVYADYRYVDTSNPGARRIANEDFIYAPSAAGLHIEKEIFRGGEYYYGYKKAKQEM